MPAAIAMVGGAEPCLPVDLAGGELAAQARDDPADLPRTMLGGDGRDGEAPRRREQGGAARDQRLAVQDVRCEPFLDVDDEQQALRTIEASCFRAARTLR